MIVNQLTAMDTQGFVEVEPLRQEVRRLEIENQQVKDRLRQVSRQLITIQEAERRRISQDLHDSIGQGMTALILQLNDLRTSLLPYHHDIRAQLLRAIWSVEALMKEVRQMAYQLRPPSLDSMPLSRALESLCALFAQTGANMDNHAAVDLPRAGLWQKTEPQRFSVDFSSDKDLPPIPDLQATALYRLVQEGLNNVIRHAHANAVWVNLDYEEGEVSVSVEDNGHGFFLQEAQDGMGLQGIRERFRMLNGTFEVDSAPGRGTRLSGSLPLPSEEKERCR